VIRVGDDGRRGARALGILDHLGLAAFHDGHAAVGGAEVDADDLGHGVAASGICWFSCSRSGDTDARNQRRAALNEDVQVCWGPCETVTMAGRSTRSLST